MSDIALAQLQLLAFLATVALVGACTLGAIGLAIAGRRRGAVLAAGAAVVAAGLYGGALLVLGATSRERVLAAGEPKVFCELDCHLAYTVARTESTPTAEGARYLVTLRTWFDPRTTSERRGDAELWPNPRRVRLVDARGGAWTPAETTGTPLDTRLRPGASYETTFAFDVPADVETPRLELTEAAAITRLVAGHENSPLHRKTLLALGNGVAARR